MASLDGRIELRVEYGLGLLVSHPSPHHPSTRYFTVSSLDGE